MNVFGWVLFRGNKMCGIVGYIGKRNAMGVLMEGLENLEYRGYDSAGIAMRVKADHDAPDTYLIEKAVGKLSVLKRQIADLKITASSGIGHTRWATHGAPSLANAHPHHVGNVILVHNGIIENHAAIKVKLTEQGRQFYSNTDTEVAANLLDSLLSDGIEPLKAISKLCDILHGAYAFGIMIKDHPDEIFFAKNGSPLLVARGEDELFFASDQAALVDYQPQFYALIDNEIGCISRTEVKVFDLKGKARAIEWMPLTARKESAQKLGHKHFMLKEIYEQPETIDRVLRGRLNEKGIDFSGFTIDFGRLKHINRIHLVACGSAYYASLIAKPLLESTLRLPCEVEIASEYRYRETLTDSHTLVIAVSQSGETVDTLAALTKAHELGAPCMSVCNVLGSAIASLCEKSLGNVFINAGPEISVASTKAFVGQIVALRLFTMAFAVSLGKVENEETRGLFSEFMQLKAGIEAVLKENDFLRSIAEKLVNEPRMFYLGRGSLFPVALEGALKMKELSYIFAEGYPAGELKHGPIAIIDPGMPVIVLFGCGPLSIKTASNLQEVKARGAKVISVAPDGLLGVDEESAYVIRINQTSSMLEPILTTIPLQLLAYHLSDLKGVDVDKPRNLAKSVTVE